ncbi:MAG TPA: hypothetical protein VI455_20390, partial [Terriglobia bacterium]
MAPPVLRGLPLDIDSSIYKNLGIHLTQVTPTYSMRAHGGLPSDRSGLRGSLPLGAGLPGVSVPTPL